jgi:hypothetical protein
MNEKKYYSIPEYARIVGLSRIAIFNKVKGGKIKAMKIGRNYAIPYENASGIPGKELSNEEKKDLDIAVEKTIRDYGETLKRLGNE